MSKLVIAIVLILLMASMTTANEAGEAFIKLDSHRGDVVYVDFWASWCPPCRASFPWLDSLRAQYTERGLTVLTVNVDRDSNVAREFLRTAKTEDMPVIFDADGKIAEAFNLEAMPTSFVYGRDGVLRSTHMGFDKKIGEEIKAEILKLLAEEASHE